MKFKKEYTDYDILIKSLHERDISAFDYVYTTLRVRLFALACYILEDEENAKDLVQDLFADFWENRLYQQVTSTLDHYLIRTIKNRAINYKKRLSAVAKITAVLDDLKADNSYSSIDNQELSKKLDAAMKKLPPMASKVFQLHYIEQLSYDEIGLRLGISRSTISTHMDRALKKLRAYLKKEE